MHSPRAFSLIEVLLALGVFAVVAVSIIGLLTVGLNLNRDSIDESYAINAMTVVINDRLSTPRTNISGVYDLPAVSPTGWSDPAILFLNDGYMVTNQSSAIYKVVAKIFPPGTNTSAPYLMHCQVTWPASAATPRGMVETVAAIPQATFLSGQ